MSCEAPSTTYDLTAFSFAFERNFDYCGAKQLVTYLYSNYIHHILLGYLIAVFGIKNYMRDRKPFELKNQLIAWNFLLAAFSGIGAIKTGTELVSVWANEGKWSTFISCSIH